MAYRCCAYNTYDVKSTVAMAYGNPNCTPFQEEVDAAHPARYRIDEDVSIIIDVMVEITCWLSLVKQCHLFVVL